MTPLVIVNPASAGGRARTAWPGLAAEIRRHAGPFDVAFTAAPGDGARLAAEAARAGRALVVALGGDGTISEVADGLLRARSTAALGILPFGTGVDFRRTLELPTRIADAARVIAKGRTRRIDAARVSFVDHGGAPAFRHFVNIASFGLSAAVATRANASSKRLGGRLAFAKATLVSALEHEAPTVRIEIDGADAVSAPVSTVCVANGRYFGGGMCVAPDALLDDGLLDVVVVGDLGLLELLRSTPRLYAGTHIRHPRVAATRARTVTATAEGEEDVLLEIDGETPGRLPARFEVLPGALDLVVPA